MAVRFTWDPRKAALNERKHGLTFLEAATVYVDRFSITMPDPIHSEGEERSVLIGQSYRGRLLVVIHVEQGDEIRLISARPATRRERRVYEEETSP